MNVSPHELTDFSFLEDMERLSRSHDVSLASFEIEITEGSLINNVAHTLEVLERAGFRQEGLQRENFRFAGRFSDTGLYALLGREFRAARP